MRLVLVECNPVTSDPCAAQAFFSLSEPTVIIILYARTRTKSQPTYIEQATGHFPGYTALSMHQSQQTFLTLPGQCVQCHIALGVGSIFQPTCGDDETWLARVMNCMLVVARLFRPAWSPDPRHFNDHLYLASRSSWCWMHWQSPLLSRFPQAPCNPIQENPEPEPEPKHPQPKV